jgi:hypothetical protein
MVGMALAKSIYSVPTWTRAVALVREHAALRTAVVGGAGDVPSVYACYRFTAKLRTYGDMLDRCIDRVTTGLSAQLPEYGPQYRYRRVRHARLRDGQRYVSKGGCERAADEYADPDDASWGHRSAVSTRKGGGFYGYKIDMAVCTATDLPIAWNVRTAREAEQAHALALVDAAKAPVFGVRDGRDGTRAMTPGSSTRGARTAMCGGSSRSRSHRASSAATTRRRRASTVTGGSPEPTTAETRPSGAA